MVNISNGVETKYSTRCNYQLERILYYMQRNVLPGYAKNVNSAQAILLSQKWDLCRHACFTCTISTLHYEMYYEIHNRSASLLEIALREYFISSCQVYLVTAMKRLIKVLTLLQEV